MGGALSAREALVYMNGTCNVSHTHSLQRCMQALAEFTYTSLCRLGAMIMHTSVCEPIIYLRSEGGMARCVSAWQVLFTGGAVTAGKPRRGMHPLQPRR